MRRLLVVATVLGLLVACQNGPRVLDERLRACATHHQRPVGPKFCTHGDDTAEAICLLHQLVCYSPPKPGPVLPPPPPPGCIGDGVSGDRVQAFYAYTAATGNNLDAPDGSTTRRTTILSALGDADRYLFAGSGKHYRWACSGGEPTVTPIQVADDSLNSFIGAALAAGYNSHDRIYTALIDSGGGGVATVEFDDQPGPNNQNNSGPAFSLTRGVGAWPTLVHELGHNLGAVQLSAPHSSGAWHCHDGYDVMCYNDNGPYYQNGGTFTTTCSAGENQWDCDDDDYSNPAPPAGTYLHDHWNVATSAFLG